MTTDKAKPAGVQKASIHDHGERRRVQEIYESRAYDSDPTYSDINSVYLHRCQSIERQTLSILKSAAITAQVLAESEILDFGCGNGRWLGRWLAWGAVAPRLSGVDIRPEALAKARTALPLGITFMTADESGGVDRGDDTYDIIFQNLVLSSILSTTIRQAVADEMTRLLKPGGSLILCDFSINNPRNKNVRALKREETEGLFSSLSLQSSRKVVLAPPLARRLVPLSWTAATLIEAALPGLRTHRLFHFRKAQGVGL